MHLPVFEAVKALEGIVLAGCLPSHNTRTRPQLRMSLGIQAPSSAGSIMKVTWNNRVQLLWSHCQTVSCIGVLGSRQIRRRNAFRVLQSEFVIFLQGMKKKIEK
jgi:hypothetical protein